MRQYEGPARFSSPGDALKGILSGGEGRRRSRDPLRSPRGGPGMQEMLSPTRIVGADQGALITDGVSRSTGPVNRHVAPEAERKPHRRRQEAT